MPPAKPERALSGPLTGEEFEDHEANTATFIGENLRLRALELAVQSFQNEPYKQTGDYLLRGANFFDFLTQ